MNVDSKIIIGNVRIYTLRYLAGYLQISMPTGHTLFVLHQTIFILKCYSCSIYGQRLLIMIKRCCELGHFAPEHESLILAGDSAEIMDITWLLHQ